MNKEKGNNKTLRWIKNKNKNSIQKEKALALKSIPNELSYELMFPFPFFAKQSSDYSCFNHLIK